MREHEYKKFCKLYDELFAYDKEWAKHHFGKKTLNYDGKEVNALDVLGYLRGNGYEKNKKVFGIQDELVFGYLGKILDDMQGLSEMYKQKKIGEEAVNLDDLRDGFFVDNEAEKNFVNQLLEKNGYTKVGEELASVSEVTKVDGNFFTRMQNQLQKSSDDSTVDSKQYKAMKREVDSLVDYLEDNRYDLNKEEYLKRLNKIEELADAYLVHKLKKDPKANSIGKINAAVDMKKYIAERRAEIYRNDLNNNIVNEYDGKLDKAANFRDEYLIKRNELDSIHNALSDEDRVGLNGVLKNASNFMKSALRDKVVAGPDVMKGRGDCVVAEIIKNELISNGGKKTPLVEKYIKNPIDFRECVEKSDYYKNIVSDAKAFEKFINQGTKVNIYDMKKAGLGDAIKEFGELSVSNNNSMIKDEKERMADKKHIREEDSPMDNMARGYANLARFAVESPLVENGKAIFKKFSETARELLTFEIPDVDNKDKAIDPVKEQIKARDVVSNPLVK